MGEKPRFLSFKGKGDKAVFEDVRQTASTTGELARLVRHPSRDVLALA